MYYITACIDGNNYSRAVIDLAIWASLRLGTPLKLLHVIDKSSQEPESQLSGAIGLNSREELMSQLVILDEKRSKLEVRYGKTLLNDLKNLAMIKGVESITTQQRHGHLVETLLEMGPETRMLILGKSGELHQNDTKTIGSQLESVVRSVDTHILIANQEHSNPTSYVLAFDGSETSQRLVEKAIRTPLLEDMVCHLTMVQGSDEKQAIFDDAFCRLRQAGIDVVRASLKGTVHSALLNYQQLMGVDMIVMGAYGHSQLRQFFVGSNTTRLLIDASVPMLLIR